MESTSPAVNACLFSPCGTYLISGTALGKLHVWKFTQAAEGGDEEGGGLLPSRVAELQAHTIGCAIYALAFAETKSGLLLLSGADEEICGWKWDAILKAGSTMPAAVLRLENPRTALRRGALGQLSETSALAVDASGGVLYSAAGNGDAYAWDLTTQSMVSTFSGVGEPLHCLTLCSKRKQLVTGGEEGAVRLWDVRSAKCEHVVTPTTLAASSTASSGAKAGGGTVGGGGGAAATTGGGVGGWCGCVGVDDDETWLVAGWSDGFLCSLDLNTRAVVACMPTAAAPLAAAFEPGSDFHVVSIGAESGLYHWRLTGELETRATCSSPTALGLAISGKVGGKESGQQVIAVGGSAGTVDVFTDLSHRAFTLCM